MATHSNGISVTSRHLVALHQEVPHAIVDIRIDRPLRHQPGPIAEVGGPAEQQAVQLASNLGPRTLVAGDQEIADLPLEPRDALLGRTRSEVIAHPGRSTRR